MRDKNKSLEEQLESDFSIQSLIDYLNSKADEYEKIGDDEGLRGYSFLYGKAEAMKEAAKIFKEVMKNDD